jgi:hypothetical protein
VTKQIQLDGDGPFETQWCRGLAASPRPLPIRIRFILASGQELLVPIEEPALRRIYKLLHGQFGEKL